MNALTTIAPAAAGGVSLARIANDRTRHFVLAEKAESSRKAYATDFGYFATWCLAHGFAALPASPDAVADYLSCLADQGLAPATIARRAAACRYVHQISGLPTPTDHVLVKATIRGIRRELGAAPRHQKSAIVAKQIGAMLDTCDGSLLGRRDRALIALGFAAALRRSELVALQMEDLQFGDRGLDVQIRRSKGDQDGQGATLAVPHGASLYPVAAVRDWLTASGIASGPVFWPVGKGGRLGEVALSAHAVAVLVKGRARRVGVDPATVSGHSLRAGYVTSAVEHGAAPLVIAEQTRHRSLDMLLIYSRRVDRYRNHSGKAFL